MGPPLFCIRFGCDRQFGRHSLALKQPIFLVNLGFNDLFVFVDLLVDLGDVCILAVILVLRFDTDVFDKIRLILLVVIYSHVKLLLGLGRLLNLWLLELELLNLQRSL